MQLFCWVTFTLNVWQQRWTICDRGNHAIVIAQWFFFIRWTVLWWHHEVSNQGPLVQQLRTYPLGHSRCYCEDQAYFFLFSVVSFTMSDNRNRFESLWGWRARKTLLPVLNAHHLLPTHFWALPCLALHCIAFMSCHVMSFLYIWVYGEGMRGIWTRNFGRPAHLWSLTSHWFMEMIEASNWSAQCAEELVF